jgi:hypothetical protein
MSSTDHATGDDVHDAHDHEPAPPPEPESPAWLPLLGGGLFLLGLLVFLFTRTPEPANAAEGAAAEPSKPPAAAPPSDAALRPRVLPSNPEVRALADKMRAPGAAPMLRPAAPPPNRPSAPPNPPAGH